MSEEELLEEIFEGKDASFLWKGKYKVFWCDLCDSYNIGCLNPECGGSSCNAKGCVDCIEVHKDFNKAKTCAFEYLNEEERKIYEKIWWLKRYVKDSLKHSEYEINWKRLKEDGELSQYAEEAFEKEIKEYYERK